MFTKNDVMAVISIVVFSSLVSYFIFNCFQSIKEEIAKKYKELKDSGDLEGTILSIIAIIIFIIIIVTGILVS